MAGLSRYSSLHVVEFEDVEYPILVDTLVDQFDNDIKIFLNNEEDPYHSVEFRQSYVSLVKQKVDKFDSESVQYPDETRDRHRRSLLKSMHLLFLSHIARREATPKIREGFNDPSNYFWDKIRKDFNTVKLFVQNCVNTIVAESFDSSPDHFFPELRNEIKNSSQNYVDEVFKELVTKLSDCLFISLNFDSQFDKVTWVDFITFGLFANIKDKYIKACEYVMDLVQKISIYQMDPLNPVVLFDEVKIEAMRRNLEAHAGARREKALSKRSVKRIRALKIGLGVGVGVGAVIGIGSLILAGAILICSLSPAGATVLVGALGCLALKIAALALLICTKNQKAIESAVRDIFSGSGGSKSMLSF